MIKVIESNGSEVVLEHAVVVNVSSDNISGGVAIRTIIYHNHDSGLDPGQVTVALLAQLSSVVADLSADANKVVSAQASMLDELEVMADTTKRECDVLRGMLDQLLVIYKVNPEVLTKHGLKNAHKEDKKARKARAEKVVEKQADQGDQVMSNPPNCKGGE